MAKGTNVTVWRGEGYDGPMEEVLSSSAVPTLTTVSMWFISGANAAFAYDDVQIVANGWTSGTTFATNGGNELTSSTFGGVTTTYGYDAWGQMTSKARGSYTATYAWHYGGMLTKVESDFRGEGTVTFAYGGDGKRRERDDGSTVTWYNYDLGWNLLNEEDNTGALTTTFVHAPQGSVGPVLAYVAGSNPASGTYRYYRLDHLGSTNGLYDGAKAKISALAYSPYGASYSDVGPGPLPRYTGHLWESAAGLHLAPYRAYAPDLARWLSRDPSGMMDGPNLYSYVRQNPIGLFDPDGRIAWLPVCCVACAGFAAWDVYDVIANSPCQGQTGGDFVACMAKAIANKLLFGDSCAAGVLMDGGSPGDIVNGLSDCIKCDLMGTLRDAGKALSCGCCAGLLMHRIPIPQPPRPRLPLPA